MLSRPMLRPIWILTLALPLLGGPAGAVPCSDDTCRVGTRAPARQDARGASSLELSPIGRGAWSYGVSRHFPVVDVPPGLARRDRLPPGLARRDVLPPGLRARIDWPPSTSPDRVVTLPGSSQDPGTDSAAVPEPTGALLFASGLLVAAAAVRRARRSAGTVARA